RGHQAPDPRDSHTYSRQHAHSVIVGRHSAPAVDRGEADHPALLERPSFVQTHVVHVPTDATLQRPSTSPHGAYFGDENPPPELDSQCAYCASERQNPHLPPRVRPEY